MHAAKRRSAFTVAIAAAAGFLLSACASSGPSYPLYSSQAVTGSFGFSEQKISANSFKVTYVTPTRGVADSRRAIDERREQLLAQSNDFAIWRAADLALANGQKEFRVTRRDNDVDVQRDSYDPYPYGRRYYGPPRYGRGPYYGPDFYGPPWPDTYVRINARTTLIVEFGRKPGEDYFVAEDAIAKARQTYPGADQPPVVK